MYNIYTYIHTDDSSPIIAKQRNKKENKLKKKARTPATSRDHELKLII